MWVSYHGRRSPHSTRRRARAIQSVMRWTGENEAGDGEVITPYARKPTGLYKSKSVFKFAYGIGSVLRHLDSVSTNDPGLQILVLIVSFEQQACTTPKRNWRRGGHH